MRKIGVITVLLATCLVTGCGGGGASSADPAPLPTQTTPPLRTPVNITAVKTLYNGTAPAGTQASFTLTGSDLQGNSWTGSYGLFSDGATTFQTRDVTSSRSVLTLQKAGGAAPETRTTTRYYYAWPKNPSVILLYSIIDNSGRVISLAGDSELPDVPLIGEWATSGASASDGTKELVGWMLDPDVNGNSKLTFSLVIKAADNSILSREDDSFYLDSMGSMSRMTVVATVDGTTVTLSGNRN